MITSTQMRAARALLGMDQKSLAALAGVSVPTIQRMEASNGQVRGVIESLSRVVDALNEAGAELLSDGAVSQNGGRGVRLRNEKASVATAATGASGDQTYDER